ncbi:glycosyl hydrolase [Sphingomonas tabacisoli]|uniref:Glycosyl hydrolase n=1 Tax=Sphingomonas tabacisoli TaxID=2249466 RepID=A0ABW4I7X2_9SPHN
MRPVKLLLPWLAATMLSSPVMSADPLADAFRDPPASARPRVWWHWMNGNVTKDGIAKDLAWMKRVGIGGLQNFDANLQTPKIVDQRLVYMTPEWKDAFRFAAAEADRLGLEFAIASSPGWSETGGPWVKPADGMKKLVWSEAVVEGGRAFTGKLPNLPTATGPFQNMGPADAMAMAQAKAPPPPTGSGEVAVLAFLIEESTVPKIESAKSGAGKSLDIAALSDSNAATAVEVERRVGSEPGSLVVSFGTPQTIRSATILIPNPAASLLGPTEAPRLEASDDGAKWRNVTALPTMAVPTTASFAPVTARYFRLVLEPAPPSSLESRGSAPGIDQADFRTMIRNGLSRTGIKVAEFELSHDAKIDRYETKAAFELVPDYYSLSNGIGEAKGVAPGRVIDLTSRLRPDGTLDWTPPRGRWRVLRLGWSLTGKTNHPAPQEATGLEVDKFDGPAVRRYMEHYLGMYREASGGRIGDNGVRAFLTDSTEVGAANWTPQLIEQFKTLRGYDPTPWLPALTGTIVGSRAESDKFLYDFRRTLADLHASQHYATVAAVAHENGLKVYGEALEDKRPVIGDDMAMRRYADIPMAAMWTYPHETEPRLTLLADMKGAASVAHIYGQNLVAAESLTSAAFPWAHGPADLKHVIDLEFVTGVNRPVIHTSVHQPVDDKKPGLSLFIFGQYFNRHETWAELARPWVDYMARNSLLLQQGRNVADVGYFYGEEAPLTGLYGEHVVADAPKAYAYDFVNAEALTSALRNDGAELATPGGARYRALYLGGSSRQMTLPTLRKIVALVEGGATVIGPKPVGNPSLAGAPAEFAALTDRLWPGGRSARVGKGQVIATTDIEAALAEIGLAPDFRYTGGQADSEVPFLHRKLDDGDSYFLVNRKDRSETIEAHFRVTGKAPELWRAETGTSEPVSYRTANGETVVPLTLAAEESIHIVFRRPAQADAMAVKKVAPREVAALSGPWNVSFEAGRGAPATATFASLAPLDQNSDSGIKYFSGVATYSKTFDVPKSWKPNQPLWLDLGEAREIAEVTVNGKPAGYAWHAPYRVDISSAAKPGRNTLQVRVANLWVNRLIGDRQPGAEKITWTATPPYKADAPLRRSGLIGPVTLLSQ